MITDDRPAKTAWIVRDHGSGRCGGWQDKSGNPYAGDPGSAHDAGSVEICENRGHEPRCSRALHRRTGRRRCLGASAQLRPGVGAVGDGATPEEAIADLREALAVLIEEVGAPPELTLTLDVAYALGDPRHSRHQGGQSVRAGRVGRRTSEPPVIMAGGYRRAWQNRSEVKRARSTSQSHRSRQLCTEPVACFGISRLATARPSERLSADACVRSWLQTACAYPSRGIRGDGVRERWSAVGHAGAGSPARGRTGAHHGHPFPTCVDLTL